MWLFGPAINKVTIYYVVFSIAGSGISAPYITETGTDSEAFFLILLALDLVNRIWKILRRKFYAFHGPLLKLSLLDQIKKLFAPLFNPLEGAHVLFVPSWCVSILFIFIIRQIAT
jgi:hypothetical protein